MAVLIIVLLVEGCDVPGFPEWQWRQKVTVEVEGPTEPLSAASVMEVICGSSPQWLRGIGGGGLGCQLQGEAVSLEIAPSQVLFALLTGAPGSQNYPKKVAYHVFFPDRTLTTVEERGEQLEKGFHGEVRDLPRQNYPLLVTFTDINDPKTVQKVDPDNLAATFGPGVSLKRMTLEITDEPVTEGKIESVLGWYWGYRDKGYRLNGKKCVACPVSSENLADLIGPGEFKIGGNK
jgi:hypothetical protein